MARYRLTFRAARPALAASLAAALLLAAVASHADDDDGDDDDLCEDPAYAEAYACREIVVEHEAGFDQADIVARYGLRAIGRIPELSLIWFEAPVGSDVPTLEEALEDEPGVEEAERNDDFRPPECRQLNGVILELGIEVGPFMRSQPALVAMRATGTPYRNAGRGVVVAVLDTGAVSSHPEIAASLLPGMDLVVGAPSAEDRGNGIDDDADGDIDEGYGHGTAVAGLIHLVAPGARILPVRVLDDECRGSAFRVAAAVVRAVEAGADVLNLSLGSRSRNGIIARALDYAFEHDVVIVSSAGHVTTENNRLAFPATEGDVIAVTAIDDAMRVPDWAIADPDVDLSAPGDALVAPWRNGYAQVSGTSFAAALVSGAAAAARAAHPQLDRAEIEALLRATAIDVRPFNPRALSTQVGAGVPDLPAIIGGSLDLVALRRGNRHVRRSGATVPMTVERAGGVAPAAEALGEEP